MFAPVTSSAWHRPSARDPSPSPWFTRHSMNRKELAMSQNTCAHLAAITSVLKPKHQECEECVKIGSEWVHLRICQECGVTLCCDSSINRHATRHANMSGHPVVASAQPRER